MIATAIARIILDGFDLHYWLFREYSLKAREHFEAGEWASVWATSRARIDMYDLRVVEAVTAVEDRYPEACRDESLWPEIKRAYIGLLYQHLQPECAETFFNSVACRVLHRTYYHNEYLFWRPAVSTEHLEGDEPSYRCYAPQAQGLRATLRAILFDFGLALPFEDLRRDLRLLLGAVRRHPARRGLGPGLQIHVLASLFFRGQAAYVIGRVIHGAEEHAFAVPLRRTEAGRLYLDALLLGTDQLAALFSLARAYFMVDMEVPAAYVAFLAGLMPRKRKAELYTAIGLQKQGKTNFYRDLHEHLNHSTDRFVVAPGTRGMVMAVFTLPSFPYVFKVIRDRFDPPKDASAAEVRARYRLVKLHDRVGRMADTLEYSDVALPVRRFSEELLEELQRVAGGSLERDGDKLVIRHAYIERRMVPLDVYLRGAGEEQKRQAVQEFGDAIRDLAAVNIFPGDLLPKNFGVTRYGRVVFYDYDEICYLTECRFRRIPAPRCEEEELSAEPWYAVGPADVFPEQFATFLFPPGRARELFLELHGDLTDVPFWTAAQVRSGWAQDVMPYPADRRLRRP